MNVDTYSPTACGCKVGMYVWQHISSVDLAAAATTNLSVKDLIRNVSSEDSHSQCSDKGLVLSYHMLRTTKQSKTLKVLIPC